MHFNARQKLRVEFAHSIAAQYIPVLCVARACCKEKKEENKEAKEPSHSREIRWKIHEIRGETVREFAQEHEILCSYIRADNKRFHDKTALSCAIEKAGKDSSTGSGLSQFQQFGQSSAQDVRFLGIAEI